MEFASSWMLVRFIFAEPRRELLEKYLYLGSSRCGSVVKNLPSLHEDVGSIPGLIQWVKASGIAVNSGVGQKLQLQFDP